MPAAPYLLHVNSRPIIVSDKLWKEWYVDEHLPDLVNSGISVRATFYEEIPAPFNPSPTHPRKFLALYQTDFKESLKTENYTALRTTSEMFAKEGGKVGIQDNGDFDARNYELIQEFDPNRIGEVPPPFVVTAEIHPQPENVEDLEKWYNEEHLSMLAKIPGYRRTLRYRLGPRTPLTKGDVVPEYLALHECDDVGAFGGKEAEAANATPWTMKQMKESEVFTARGWKLMHAQGY